MGARRITFPDALISKFEEGGRLFVELILDDYDKEDIKLSAYGDYFEIFAYHASKKTKYSGTEDVSTRQKRRTLRKRIKVPAYALINQARANFQNGRLIIEMPLRSIKV